MHFIWTIGHSTRSLDEFVALLRSAGVRRLADIRRYPGSRRYPHFAREALERSLPPEGIEYVHIDALGGRRRPAPDSPNGAWRNEQFRGYADHMSTAAFRSGVETLLGSDRATAFMCSEAVPWRCHRNLLADELVRRGIEVLHILSRAAVEKHSLNRMARVESDRVIYPES